MLLSFKQFKRINRGHTKYKRYTDTVLSGNRDSIFATVSYTHLRAHETGRNLVCRLLLEKKNP